MENAEAANNWKKKAAIKSHDPISRSWRRPKKALKPARPLLSQCELAANRLDYYDHSIEAEKNT